MPKWLHDRLARAATKLRLKGKRRRAYIYSVLQRYKKRKNAEQARQRAAANRGKKKKP